MRQVEFSHFVQIALTTMDKNIQYTENGASLCWMNATSFALVCCTGLRNALEELNPPRMGTRLFMLVRMIKLFEVAFEKISNDSGRDKKQIQRTLNEHRGSGEMLVCQSVCLQI